MKRFNLLITIIIMVLFLMSFTASMVSSSIDLDNLFDYEDQYIPSYITKDNTPSDNIITDEGATLGRVLFYDKKLSIDNTVSCGSCHIQEHAFSDLANVSEGINGNLTPKHSMRLVNIRFSDNNQARWDKSVTIETQMTLPIKDPGEMGYSGENGQPSFNDLITKMDAISYYPALFTNAFGDAKITEDRIQKALAQFVRSIQSFDSKYDEGRAQVADDLTDFPNFTDDENEGKRLFMEDFTSEAQTNRVILARGENPDLGVLDTITNTDGSETVYITYDVAGRLNGGFNCATCHIPPEFNIDPNSLNNAFVRPASNNPNAPSDINNTRVHTLRDMIKHDKETLNGGMFHSGQAVHLEDIFGHYEFRRYDPIDNPNLDPRLTRVINGERLGILLNSTRSERLQINAFIATLTGNDVYTNEKWSDPFDDEGNLTLTGGELSTNDVVKNNFEIMVYPNPTFGEITIKGYNNVQDIELVDLMGQAIKTYKVKDVLLTVNISEFSAGVYFLRFKDDKHNFVETRRIIKK